MQGRGGGCLPPLQAPRQAEQGQGQLGKTCSGARRSIRPPLPAARLLRWHSSESWNHPCPNPLIHRRLNKQSALHFPLRSDLQGSAPYGCPKKRHLPTFISLGALTFNPSNIGKSSYMFGKLSLVMAYFQLMSSPVRNLLIQRLSLDS